jgi:hypothetical protein
MSDRSLYIENELMNHWPYLLKSERVARFERPPREYMESFFLALDAKPHFTPLLAWKGSAGRLSGCWRSTPHAI